METQSNIGVNAALNGELYINERTGRTHVRLPAGGAGGGITSYADQPASEEQHVAFLKTHSEAKKAESERLKEESGRLAKHHEKANGELEKRQNAEREATEKDQRADENSDTTDIDEQNRNPITDQTYGRPPLNPPGLDGQPQQHNPGDARPRIDHQPPSDPVQNEDLADGTVE